MRHTALLAAVTALFFTAPVAAQDFAITGATVVLGDGSEPIADGTVVVRDGHIAAAGAGVAVPPDVETIDGRGRWVTPGLFSALTDLGLWDVEEVDESNDTKADDTPFGAALDVASAINPSSQHVAVSRAGGVTRASVTAVPDGSIFAGQGALIDLGVDPNAVMRARAFQLVALGESGAKIAGGSRVAAYTAFRNALAEAQALAASADRDDDVLLNRPDAAALVPVIRGEQPLYVEVDRASDILAVLALRNEYPALKLVFVGATEGWLVAREIAAAGVPVITEPLIDLPARFEQLGSTQSNVGRMVDAGVRVAIGGFAASNQPRYAPQQAGNLVALNKLPGATGLTWAEAFAAISSVPAEIAGLGGQAGVLKAGALGDVVLWDGDPLEVSSAPLRVFIDGVEQPLDNHQTRLRERYRTPNEGDLPKAYER